MGLGVQDLGFRGFRVPFKGFLLKGFIRITIRVTIRFQFVLGFGAWNSGSYDFGFGLPEPVDPQTPKSHISKTHRSKNHEAP